MTVRHSRMLTRYNHWANKVMFDAVAALPEGEAAKERKSLFKNMVHTLNQRIGNKDRKRIGNSIQP